MKNEAELERNRQLALAAEQIVADREARGEPIKTAAQLLQENPQMPGGMRLALQAAIEQWGQSH